MNRRRFLAATIGAGTVGAVAGCSGSEVRLVDRIENDPAPDGLDAEIAARLVGTASREHPPRIRIEYTSTAPSTVAFDGVVPFGDHFGTGPDGAVLVLSLPEREPSPVRDCWRTDPIAASPAIGWIDLADGETLAVEYDLLIGSGVEECWPAGRYRFEQAYPVRTGPTAVWGFTVAVE